MNGKGRHRSAARGRRMLRATPHESAQRRLVTPGDLGIALGIMSRFSEEKTSITGSPWRPSRALFAVTGARRQMRIDQYDLLHYITTLMPSCHAHRGLDTTLAALRHAVERRQAYHRLVPGFSVLDGNRKFDRLMPADEVAPHSAAFRQYGVEHIGVWFPRDTSPDMVSEGMAMVRSFAEDTGREPLNDGLGE